MINQPVFDVREIVWVDLPVRMPRGHEQHGRRPVVIVALPERVQQLPYRMLLGVPLTRSQFTGSLFPLLSSGAGGLTADSTALVYQLLSIDVDRIKGRIGILTDDEYQPIKDALHLMMLS